MIYPSTAPSQHLVVDAMPSSTRLLVGCMLASAVLHIVFALGLPGWWQSEPPLNPAVLEVVLMPQAEVVPASPEPPDPKPLTPRAKPALVAPEPRAVPTTPARTEIAVAPTAADTAFPAVVETVRPPAVAPQAPSAAPRSEAPVTPPVFNAAYLRNPPPRYPLASRRNSEEGTVMLRVLVTTEGTASRVELDRSSGSPSLDGAALEAVRSWRFVPARRGTQNIEDWVRVPVVFRLES